MRSFLFTEAVTFARLVKSIYGGKSIYRDGPQKIDSFLEADLFKGPPLEIGLTPTSKPNTIVAYIMLC
jgi:hypothetical protein